VRPFIRPAGTVIEVKDMRRVALTASVVVIASLTIGLGQEKPDFSGTWTMVGEQGKRATTMVVTQSSASMMLEVTPPGKDTVRYVFPVYDAERANPAPSQDGAPPATGGAPPATGTAARATWDGATLVLSTPISDGARVLRQTWSLVDGNLVVTLAEVVQATGAVLREAKQTFKKG
jgi:hypothetical protein